MPYKKASKKVQAPWYDALPVKVEKITANGNIVCKKISKKDLAAVKAAGYSVKRIPNGSFVICHK